MKKLLVLSLALSAAAHADHQYNYTSKWGVGGSYGFNTPVFGNITNKAADGDENWGFHLRYHTDAKNLLELGYTRHELSDTNLVPQVTDLTWVHRLRGTARLTPVVGLGAGVVDVLKYTEDNLKLSAKLRAGLEYALCPHTSLGLNVDYTQVHKMFGSDNLDGRNMHLLAARVGLTWYWDGAETDKHHAAPVAAAPVAAVAAVEGDDDNDGVVNSKDKCPATQAGEQVNAYGCTSAEKASVHLDVKFASGKAVLDHTYDADLKELADFAAEHPQTKIEIQGHTDSSGNKVLNKKLSLARAEAVKAYLVKELNVDASRLEATGHGDEQPVADNSTLQGKAKNRRVVAVISE